MPENNKLIVPPFNKKDIRDIVQKDITDGEIVLPTVEAGTKWYQHTVSVTIEGTTTTFRITSLNNTVINNKAKLTAYGYSFQCIFQYTNGTKRYPCVIASPDNNTLHIQYLDGNGDFTSATYNLSSATITDTVTEL